MTTRRRRTTHLLRSRIHDASSGLCAASLSCSALGRWAAELAGESARARRRCRGLCVCVAMASAHHRGRLYRGRSSINAVHLKDRFGDVETDCRDRLHGCSPESRGALTAPTSSALTCRVEEPSTASKAAIGNLIRSPCRRRRAAWPAPRRRVLWQA
jgi:hypothetical protein